MKQHPEEGKAIPPGGELGGRQCKDRGQTLNLGYGADLADLERGHLFIEGPPKFQPLHPQRAKAPGKGGFISRESFMDDDPRG